MILAVMMIVIRDADKTVTYPQYSAVVSAPRPSCTHVGYLVPRITNKLDVYRVLALPIRIDVLVVEGCPMQFNVSPVDGPDNVGHASEVKKVYLRCSDFFHGFRELDHLLVKSKYVLNCCHICHTFGNVQIHGL